MFFRPICLFCGYRPCSVDADICPRCGHADPNPGVVSRLKQLLNAFLSAITLLILGCVAAGMGANLDAKLGVGIASLFALAALGSIGKGAWYALDPTYSLLPRPRSYS